MNSEKIRELQKFAARIRVKTIEMIAGVGKGHIGGAMSIAEVLAVLYGGVMNLRPEDPGWPGRDRLVLSKGHAGPALYAALCLRGFFPDEWLLTMNQPGTRLPSHVNAKLTPGVDVSTGSLGQGLSVAVGMALANRLDENDCYIYCILGDGECQEGQIWEAMMLAGNLCLCRLILFIDHNRRQCGDYVDRINSLNDLQAKLSSFNFAVMSVDGHDVAQISLAVQSLKERRETPGAIILNTVKGRGCSFAELMEDNHHIQVGEMQAAEAIFRLQQDLNG